MKLLSSVIAMFLWLFAAVTVMRAQWANITTNPEKQMLLGVQAPRLFYPVEGILEFDVELRGWINNPSSGVAALVSGLDPINGFRGMTLGDIFIKAGHGDVIAPTRPLGELAAISYVNGAQGYDYALHLVGSSGATLLYQVYDLNPTSVLVSLQDPLDHGGELAPMTFDTSTADFIGDASTLVETVLDTEFSALTGIPNHTWPPAPWFYPPARNRTNYVAGFDLSFMAPETSFTIFVGQSSGRDWLTGKEMPEASTWLGGCAVAAFAAGLIGFRKFRSRSRVRSGSSAACHQILPVRSRHGVRGR